MLWSPTAAETAPTTVRTPKWWEVIYKMPDRRQTSHASTPGMDRWFCGDALSFGARSSKLHRRSLHHIN